MIELKVGDDDFSGRASKRLAALNDADKNRDHGNNEEDMNESTQRIARYKSEQPKDEENDGDGIKHGNRRLRLVDLRDGGEGGVNDEGKDQLKHRLRQHNPRREEGSQ